MKTLYLRIYLTVVAVLEIHQVEEMEILHLLEL